MPDFDYEKLFKMFDFNEIVYGQKAASQTNPKYSAQYTLPKGKGWRSIASKFIISKKDFIKNNQHLAKYFENEKLSIPAGTKFNVPGHKAQKGDTATSIATKYGMTVKEFLELNNMDNKTAKVLKDKVYYVYAQPSEAFKKKMQAPIPEPQLEIKPPLAPQPVPSKAPVIERTTQTRPNNPVNNSVEISEMSDAQKIKSVSKKSDVSKVTGISQEFINKLIEFEGVKRELSEDPISRPIVGIGHDLACRPKKELQKYRKLKARGYKLSDKDMYQLLTKDILEAQNGLKKTFGANYNKLTQAQKEALIDLIFNTGVSTFRESKKLIGHINEGFKHKGKNPKKADACFYNAAMEFDHRVAGGEVLPGLCKRRINDMMIFTNHKPSQMPRKVLEKLYENYAKGLYAARNKTEYFRTTNELMGCQLVKNRRGQIETASLSKPTRWINNKRNIMTDVVLK